MKWDGRERRLTTIEALEKLETAGFDRAKATAIVAAFEQADSKQATRFATKTDLAELRAGLYRALWLQTGAIVAAVAALKVFS